MQTKVNGIYLEQYGSVLLFIHSLNIKIQRISSFNRIVKKIYIL